MKCTVCSIEKGALCKILTGSAVPNPWDLVLIRQATGVRYTVRRKVERHTSLSLAAFHRARFEAVVPCCFHHRDSAILDSTNVADELCVRGRRRGRVRGRVCGRVRGRVRGRAVARAARAAQLAHRRARHAAAAEVWSQFVYSHSFSILVPNFGSR